MLKSMFDNSGAAYNPKRDGTLAEYLEIHNGSRAFPLFHGLDQYYMLWDQGYLVEEFSVIRIMWNVGRGDEHYSVVSRDKLEGLDASHHAGKPGFHSVRRILGSRNCPAWEAQSLSHNPRPGKNKLSDLVDVEKLFRQPASSLKK